VITLDWVRQMSDEFTRLEEAMRTLGFTEAEIAEVWRKAPKNKQRLEEPCVLIDPKPQASEAGSRWRGKRFIRASGHL